MDRNESGRYVEPLMERASRLSSKMLYLMKRRQEHGAGSRIYNLIDVRISKLNQEIDDLNEAGYITEASCQGRTSADEFKSPTKHCPGAYI